MHFDAYSWIELCAVHSTSLWYILSRAHTSDVRSLLLPIGVQQCGCIHAQVPMHGPLYNIKFMSVAYWCGWACIMPSAGVAHVASIVLLAPSIALFVTIVWRSLIITVHGTIPSLCMARSYFLPQELSHDSSACHLTIWLAIPGLCLPQLCYLRSACPPMCPSLAFKFTRTQGLATVSASATMFSSNGSSTSPSYSSVRGKTTL